MTECNAKQVRIETVSALEGIGQVNLERRYGAYVGLDVHKETIAMAVAWPGRDEAGPRGSRNARVTGSRRTGGMR